MLARPRRSVLYMPGSNAKALRQGGDAAGRRADPRSRGFGRARRQGEARAQVVRGGAQGRFRRARSRHQGQRAAHPMGRRRTSSPPPRPARCHSAAQGRRARRDHAGGARLMRENGAPDKTRLWAMMETPNAILNAGRSPPSPPIRPRASKCWSWASTTSPRRRARSSRPAGRRCSPGSRTASSPPAPTASTSSTASSTTSKISTASAPNAEQGREMGLDGKTLIHPSQIDICNEVFAPTAAEVDGARAIIDAFALPENAGKGVIQLNGRMVELLHADMARRTLAIARRITALAGAEPVALGSRARRHERRTARRSREAEPHERGPSLSLSARARTRRPIAS